MIGVCEAGVFGAAAVGGVKVCCSDVEGCALVLDFKLGRMYLNWFGPFAVSVGVFINVDAGNGVG